MRETKQQRNARMLNHLSGHYVSGQVVWNMARELKADQIYIEAGAFSIRPQRQDFMNQLTWGDAEDSVWFVVYSGGDMHLIAGQLGDEVEEGFHRWHQCVKAAKPVKVQTKTVESVNEMAEEMLDDMVFDDMVAWAEMRNIDFDVDGDRGTITDQVIANVGPAGWAEHFGVVLA